MTSRAMRGLLICILVALAALPMLVAQTPRQGAPARPVVPTADRHQPDKVFLEHADILKYDQVRDSFVRVLVGNVKLRKGDMFMYCDSARLNESTSSFDAFDNVRMEQGDTLYIYSDELYYDGEVELAELRAYPGNNVRLINRDVSLTTDVFFYDLADEVGFYETGGVLTDKTNTLRSQQGFYYPTRRMHFSTSMSTLPDPVRTTLSGCGPTPSHIILSRRRLRSCVRPSSPIKMAIYGRQAESITPRPEWPICSHGRR
ncbi:MAG: hypothetical protein K2K55_06795 [Duncaniella sp.]|nr:hypothetical protein [Duncaniella sp.]